jgi:hypothetical protein
MSGTNWDAFKKKYIGSGIFKGYAFNQADVLLVHRFKSDGVCRELCRMWLNARNIPICTEGLGKTITGQEWAPELELLYKNFHTIVISQAIADAGKTGRDVMDVNGLASKYMKCDIKNLGIKLLAHHGTLAIAAVSMPQGKHGIAFDTRDPDFMMFDPNVGMLITKQKFDTTEFLVSYFAVWNYTLTHAYAYSKC